MGAVGTHGKSRGHGFIIAIEDNKIGVQVLDALQLVDDLIGMFDAQDRRTPEELLIDGILQMKFLAGIARKVIDDDGPSSRLRRCHNNTG